MTIADLTIFTDLFSHNLTLFGLSWIFGLTLTIICTVATTRNPKYWDIAFIVYWVILIKGLGIYMHEGIFYAIGGLVGIIMAINALSIELITGTIRTAALSWDNMIGDFARGRIQKAHEKKLIESDIIKYGKPRGKEIFNIERKLEKLKLPDHGTLGRTKDKIDFERQKEQDKINEYFETKQAIINPRPKATIISEETKTIPYNINNQNTFVEEELRKFSESEQTLYQKLIQTGSAPLQAFWAILANRKKKS